MKYAVELPSLRAWATDYDGGFALTRRDARLWDTYASAESASFGAAWDARVVQVADEVAWRSGGA